MSIIAAGGFQRSAREELISLIAAGDGWHCASSPQALAGNGEFGRMISWRLTEENPGCSRNRGFSLAAPLEDLQVSERQPAMIGAGCPLLPLETGADRLFHGFPPTRWPLSSRWGGVLSRPSLRSRPGLLQLPLPGEIPPPATPPGEPPPSTRSRRTRRSSRPSARLPPASARPRDG